MTTLSTPQKAGVALAALLSLTSVPSALNPAPEGETGPPYVVLVLGTVLGLVGLVAAALAWRGNRGALRVLAGAIIINALTGVPAFFVDVPAWLKLLVAISVLLTVAAVVLMFAPSRQIHPEPARHIGQDRSDA